MSISIIHYDYLYGLIEGSTTTIFDVFFNIKDYFDVNFQIFSKDIGSSFKILKQNNLYDLIIYLTNNKIDVRSDTTICLYNLLTELNNKELLSININTKTLIILGTMDSFFNSFKKENIPYHWNYDKVYFLNNPPFIGNENEGRIYYHKFSKYRLDKLTKLSLQNEYRYSRLNKNHIFQNNIYFENIGKLIFEHCYYNRPVYYSPEGMTVKDGLYYNLKLFNIDGEKEQIINISKEEILNKLTMKEDDLILELISE